MRKMREKVADLARRADLAQMAGDLDMEMAIRRMHVQHIEAARRLEKDAPGIARDSGDVVPKRLFHQTVLQYSATVAAAVNNLPDRIFTLLPAIDAVLAQKIREEINDVLRTTKEIRLDAV